MTQPTSGRVRAPGRDRDHLRPRRSKQIKARYTPEEYTAIATAARDAGLTPTGYTAEAALATATGTNPPSTAPWRAVLLELIEARNQVRRIGVNINQAAKAINATGEPPEWFPRAITLTDRAITHLDQAASAVADLARRRGRQ